ncbi:MAG: hypothetical protein COB38_00570 [Gammaproteobacteria bacterium]|nr:MAG: hypothetical protein COB38_00570 [Gammaproteobacteria bacterium]
MLLEQIPAFLSSMQSLFKSDEAVQLSQSQYDLMREAIIEATKKENDNNDQARLYGILGRIGRRMKKTEKKTDTLHFWFTEYEYIASSMMMTLKENDACRLDDTLADINEIFLRTRPKNIETISNPDVSDFDKNRSNNKRLSDKQQVVSIFS